MKSEAACLLGFCVLDDSPSKRKNKWVVKIWLLLLISLLSLVFASFFLRKEGELVPNNHSKFKPILIKSMMRNHVYGAAESTP